MDLYLDVHAHLDDEAFDNDRYELIEKIKSFDGVDKVKWFEIVEVLHTRPDAPLIVLGQ